MSYFLFSASPNDSTENFMPINEKNISKPANFSGESMEKWACPAKKDT